MIVLTLKVTVSTIDITGYYWSVFGNSTKTISVTYQAPAIQNYRRSLSF